MIEATAIPHRVHIVGVGGAGMSGLAKLLSQHGHDVTGSDLKPGRMMSSLEEVGVMTWVGHQPGRMSDVGLVVVSSAVPETDPEIVAATATGAEIWRRPELLRTLTSEIPTTGLAGTHGKTTSTAMAVTAMRGIGLDPSFLVGGTMIDLNTGAHLGSDNRLILEADEAFGTFRHLHLDSILVTNVDADHLDHYGTLAALEDAFAQVVGRIDGPRVACIDDAGVRRLAQRVSVTTYGFAEEADWVVSNLTHRDGEASFTVMHDGSSVDVTLPKPGAHLALNATGVIALMHELGLDTAEIAAALASFEGVRRRYEVAAKVEGVTIVDDYAHHPTEVGATIAAAHEGAEGDVIVVFQPHRYTRTADLAPLFGEPLARADRVFVTDVYAAGEPPIIGVSGRIVAEAVEAAGGVASYVPRVGDVADRVVAIAKPGDVIVLMGAGDVNAIVPELTAGIEAQS